MYFFCRCGSKTAGECQLCTRFFVKDLVVGNVVEDYFTIYFCDLQQTLAQNLMSQVKARRFILSLIIMLAHFLTVIWGNFQVFEVANNSFSLYVIYIQVYFRINVLRSVTGQIENCNFNGKHGTTLAQKEKRNTNIRLFKIES